MAHIDPGAAAARNWLRIQQRKGNRSARPLLALMLLGSVMAVGQAFAAASVLAAGFVDAATAAAATPIGAIMIFAVLGLLRAILTYCSERAAFTVGAAARQRLRAEAMSRLLHAGPAMLRSHHSGDLATIVVDRIEALDGLFSRYIPAAAFAVAGPIIVLLAVLYADPWAALILLGCGLVVPVGMAVAGIGAAAASRDQFVALARLQARFLDRVRGIATIVLLGRARDEARALAQAATDLRIRTMRVLRVAFLSSVVLDGAAACAMIVLAVHYFGLLLGGADKTQLVGSALLVLLLTPEFFAPLRVFSAAYQERLHASGAAQALADLPSMPQPLPAFECSNVAATGVAVSFDAVRLVWDASRGPALDNLSFRVHVGETLVLSGPSGAGKSSVIEILLGFVRPDGGRVTVNGADITELAPQALSGITAWIGQRPMLFAGTIRDNIRFARPEATDHEVTKAAQAAHVGQFAAALPAGLDTRIGEGGYGLSGGQAQRIAIARAYLKNAPLLLMDEPTAHLDPATEQDVLDSLRRLAVGRTVILAGHSAATLAFGGRRLDLCDGRLALVRGAA